MVKNCAKSAVKHSTEEPILLNFVNLSTTFRPRLYIGEEAYEVYENLTTGAEDETYEAVITLLDGQFAPKNNISYERYLFRNFKQNSNEKIHQFYIRVKQQV